VLEGSSLVCGVFPVLFPVYVASAFQCYLLFRHVFRPARCMGENGWRTVVVSWFCPFSAPDSGKNARQKYEKHGKNVVKAAISVFPSTFRATLVMNLAVFTVEEALLLLRLFKELGARSKDSGRQVARSSKRKSPVIAFFNSSAELAARCLGTCLFEALGASVGTLILPGTGTVAMQTLFSVVCWLV
jgi:hypothetical protein